MKLVAIVLLLASPLACIAADRDWGAYLGDAGATHFSSLAQENVA